MRREKNEKVSFVVTKFQDCGFDDGALIDLYHSSGLINYLLGFWHSVHYLNLVKLMRKRPCEEILYTVVPLAIATNTIKK